MEINWNKYFDHIFILSRCKNFEKRERLNKELKRINLDKYVTYLYQCDSELLKYSPFLTKEVYRCRNAHYSCIKMSYELNYDNILILEDDLVFLKDIELIEYYLEKFYIERNNYNYYTFDYFIINDNIYGGGCYYLDRKGMEYFIYCLEKYNNVPNDCFVHISDLFNSDIQNVSWYLMIEHKLNIGTNIFIPKKLLPFKVGYCEEYMCFQPSIIKDDLVKYKKDFNVDKYEYE